MSICQRLFRVHRLYLQVRRLCSNVGNIDDVDTVTNADDASPQTPAEDPKNDSQSNNRVLDSTKEIADFMTKNDIPFRHGQTCFFAVCPKLGKLAMKAMKDKDCMYINSISGKHISQNW